MSFSRYQIRNEFSLADPELYKAADKDDPEASLEGVAMAGLVGVLRQLGDLAEFAAEIFHGLHEEVMVTASRGHGLLTRVQQIVSDFRSIEKEILSQTRHSAFLARSGIRWHPNLKTEQNLITKGDIPRVVMDSYEECRGPPRLFLLDKFDVAGAGACLKRYTDPSIYKFEAPSYGMIKAEAQRDKKIRKAKKNGSQWKNGDIPEFFQPSHVKLQQLLLEERVQNGTSDPARRAKLRKRESKFPFDAETVKGYMKTLLSSSPEDKLVHEVKMVNSRLHLPTDRSEGPEVKMVDSPLDDVEEKRISVDGEHKDVIDDDNQSDDVVSETNNYMDALATMESEVETDTEFKAVNSDPIRKQETLSDSNLEQLKSPCSNSQSASESDDESSSTENQITTFSYSDSSTASPNNMSPLGSDSPHLFACTEIPFRPRVLPTQISDNDHSNIQVLDSIRNNRNENDVNNLSTDNESSEESVISPELDSIPSEPCDHTNIQNLVSIHKDGNESDVDNSSTENESIEFGKKNESSEKSVISEESDSIPSVCCDLSNIQDLDGISTWASCDGRNGHDVENQSANSEILAEKTDQNGLQLHVSPAVDFQSTTQFLDSEHDSADSEEGQESKSSKFVDQEEKVEQSETLDSHNHVAQDYAELTTVDTSQLLPKLAPINLEEMPPLPPLPPMEWRMGKLQIPCLFSPPDAGQHDTPHFPPVFSQHEIHHSLNQNEQTNEKPEFDYEVKPEEQISPAPPFDSVGSKKISTSGPEITVLSSTSSLPSGDDELRNGIRPMKIQRPRTPLIEEVAPHDKIKLRKVSERAMPLFPKEEEKDTFLEQIRAKSFNLKPAVKSRPVIPGPTTNLRVAAILEKASAIRRAFAGSDDDDEDDNDSWSDS